MTVSEYTKLLAARARNHGADAFEDRYNLKAVARPRAAHPEAMHTGTAFDWEDLERYEKELTRLDKEGPGSPAQH